MFFFEDLLRKQWGNGSSSSQGNKMPDLFLTVFHENNSEIGNRLKSDSDTEIRFSSDLTVFLSFTVILFSLMWYLSYAWLEKYWCMCVLGFFFSPLNPLFNRIKKLVENVFWWRGHGFKGFSSERITFSVLRKWAFSPHTDHRENEPDPRSRL